jgi:hypothetical protein
MVKLLGGWPPGGAETKTPPKAAGFCGFVSDRWSGPSGPGPGTSARNRRLENRLLLLLFALREAGHESNLASNVGKVKNGRSALVPVLMVMIMIMIMAMIAMVTFVAVPFPLLMPLVLVPLMLTLVFVPLVVGYVNFVIPVLRNEIDGSAARVVLATVLGPVPLMSRRNVQIQRLRRRSGDDDARRDRNDGLRHDELRSRDATAYRDLTVQPGRVDTHRHIHITGLRERRCSARNGASDSTSDNQAQKRTFHFTSHIEPERLQAMLAAGHAGCNRPGC